RDAARAVRDEIFLHYGDHLRLGGRGPFGRSGAPPHPAADRGRTARGDPFGRHHRGGAQARAGDRGGAAHGGEISRGHGDRLVGDQTAPEEGADGLRDQGWANGLLTPPGVALYTDFLKFAGSPWQNAPILTITTSCWPVGAVSYSDRGTRNCRFPPC